MMSFEVDRVSQSVLLLGKLHHLSQQVHIQTGVQQNHGGAGFGQRQSTQQMPVCMLPESCWSPSRRSTPGSATLIYGLWAAVLL